MESGINARAIDFAKFGRLFLNKGNWNGRQIISEGWVNESTTPDPNDTRDWLIFGENKARGGYYKYMWWGTNKQNGDYDYRAAGKYGQYVYVSPSNRVVIVRYGRAEGDVESWPSILQELADRVGAAQP
jgi:CubicO group peptidase (beta-lactamase class C family)